MKLWHKIAIVFVSMGIVGALSFLCSVKPEMAMMLTAVNTAVVAVCSFFTGYPAKDNV